jgi:hypothetical protein
LKLLARVFRVLLVLWAGSLWSAAIWVAPTLFHAQPDRALAGLLAGHLFAIEAYVGVAIAVLALILPARAKFVWGYAAAAALALMQWVLRPVMASAHTHGSAWGLSFLAWHGVSALVYGLACLGLLLVIWNDDFR